MSQLEKKYGSQERTPGILEKVLKLIQTLYPYFQILKTLMTILTPSKPFGFTCLVFMLLWYAKNFKRITEQDPGSSTRSKLGLLKELRNDSIFYM